MERNPKMTAMKPSYRPITQPNKSKAGSSPAFCGKHGRATNVGPVGQAAKLASKNK